MPDHPSDSGSHATLAVPRSRGAFTGVLLVALGAWGALLPLIGPHFHFGYGQDNSYFHVTAARWWLQVLPGIVTVAAGLMILLAANRVTGSLAAYLACAAGAWYVVGPVLADLRSRGYVGAPLGGNDRQHLGSLAAFYGLGAVILFLAALAAGRLSVVGLRDVRAAEHRHADTPPPRGAAEGQSDPPAGTGSPATRPVPVTTTHVRPVTPPTSDGGLNVTRDPARGALRSDQPDTDDPA